jgi:eukaryotic-like serine/threonine-protein kinase
MKNAKSRECPRCGASFDESTNFCLNDGERLLLTGKLTGQLLDGRYRIEGIVGQGGMGVVYRAKHIHIDAPVAIKVLNHALVSNQSAIERFRREAKAAGRFSHPNAVQVTDFGVADEETVYLVMELVEGKSLRELLREKSPFEVGRAVNLMTQACSAVDAAHESGVIHRDLKPDNILVRNMGAVEEVKVLDFGIAKLKQREGVVANFVTLTEAGAIIGTPSYMSPEQCHGHELDTHSDIYSLGVITYEMLCGQPPFDGETAAEIIAKHLRDEPRPLRSLRPGMPPALDLAVLRALSKDPLLRQRSAKAFGQELLDGLRVTRQETIASGLQRTGEWKPAARETALTGRESNDQQGRMTVASGTGAPRTIVAGASSPMARDGVPSRRLPLALAAATALVVIALGAYLLWLRGQEPRNDLSSANASSAPEGMQLIPGGKYMMGRNDGEEDERPAHEVEVGSFYLDKYEVTRQQYKKFTDDTGRHVPRNWTNNGALAPGERLLPVTFVTWEDAADYAKWAGKRLPTEEEWEYAARGGAKGNLYPWGNQWVEGYANVDLPRLEPGGSFESDVNPFGVYDLAGNVSEWVQNYYSRYGAPSEKKYRVYRGGNFTAEPNESSATYRWYDFPSPSTDPAQEKDKNEYNLKVFPVVGFRCAKDVGR